MCEWVGSSEMFNVWLVLRRLAERQAIAHVHRHPRLQVRAARKWIARRRRRWFRAVRTAPGSG